MKGLKLTVLGAGTAVPQLGRSAPSTLVRVGSTVVLVDLGSGAIQGAFVHAGIGPDRIDLILITHLHLDHCSDLPALLFAMRAGEVSRTRPLTIAGPPGLAEHYETLRHAHGAWVEPRGYELALREWAGGEWGFRDVRVRACMTRHSVPNLAYRIDGKDTGPGCLLTGDGEKTPELVRLGEKVSALVAESSLPPGETAAGHMNPRQAAELARRCRAGALILNHLNPACRDEEVLREASAFFEGPVIVARDGLTWETAGGRKERPGRLLFQHPAGRSSSLLDEAVFRSAGRALPGFAAAFFGSTALLALENGHHLLLMLIPPLETGSGNTVHTLQRGGPGSA